MSLRLLIFSVFGNEAKNRLDPRELPGYYLIIRARAQANGSSQTFKIIRLYLHGSFISVSYVLEVERRRKTTAVLNKRLIPQKSTSSRVFIHSVFHQMTRCLVLKTPWKTDIFYPLSPSLPHEFCPPGGPRAQFVCWIIHRLVNELRFFILFETALRTNSF